MTPARAFVALAVAQAAVVWQGAMAVVAVGLLLSAKGGRDGEA
jgi:hypothetical protein